MGKSNEQNGKREKARHTGRACPPTHEAFARHGIQYLPSPKVRSDIYLAFLPLQISQRVELLDNPKMLLQFQTLIRETGKSGKDKVNHAIGAHDDSCNACAGARVLASAAPAAMAFNVPFVAERPRSYTSPRLPPNIAEPDYQADPLAPSRPEYQSGSLGDQFAWFPPK
jgi:hypothetical protein